MEAKDLASRAFVCCFSENVGESLVSLESGNVFGGKERTFVVLARPISLVRSLVQQGASYRAKVEPLEHRKCPFNVTQN